MKMKIRYKFLQNMQIQMKELANIFSFFHINVHEYPLCVTSSLTLGNKIF
jgi:hypothetical protein